MAKFNEVQRIKRNQKAERRRAIKGDPDQKAAIEKGLIINHRARCRNGCTSQDVKAAPSKVHLKKNLKIKKLKNKGKFHPKEKKSSELAAEATADVMVEWLFSTFWPKNFAIFVTFLQSYSIFCATASEYKHPRLINPWEFSAVCKAVEKCFGGELRASTLVLYLDLESHVLVEKGNDYDLN
ncbi:hypothetical protein RJ641_033582 [Dillenia turbinata]|uniref:Uncharacterized protein n=1 Tax=Dillenia turbinata TaxID=194707 RepID=A0AAN8VZW4_9MAGN